MIKETWRGVAIEKAIEAYHLWEEHYLSFGWSGPPHDHEVRELVMAIAYEFWVAKPGNRKKALPIEKRI